jgi:predicted nucleic acid-binding protein
VALAEDMGAALLTADRAMTRAVQKDALVEMMAYENP